MRLPFIVLALCSALASCSSAPVPSNPCDDDTSLWVDATYDGMRRTECVHEIGVVAETDGMPLTEPNYPDFAVHVSPDVPVTILPANPSLDMQNIPFAAGESGDVGHDRVVPYAARNLFVTLSSGEPTREPWWLVPRSGRWRVVEPATYGEHFTLEVTDLELEPWSGHTLVIHRMEIRAFLPAAPIVLDGCGLCIDAGVADAG